MSVNKQIFLISIGIVTLVIFYSIGLKSSIDASSIPAGSYQRSCDTISYNEPNDILSARCRDMDGRWHTTTLNNVKRCSGGDIANCNGELKCTGLGIPNGSYRNSCWCCYVTMTQQNPVKYRLVCYCNPKKGKSVLTSLEDAFGCNKDIANCNGKLTCGGC